MFIEINNASAGDLELRKSNTLKNISSTYFVRLSRDLEVCQDN